MASHRFSATTKEIIFRSHSKSMRYFQKRCQPNYSRRCCLQFGALGGFLWRELSSFGWLRQALVHVQTENSLGRLPRPSSRHTHPVRRLQPANPIHLIMATRLTRANSSNLSTQFRRAHTRNNASPLASAPGADHHRTHASEQIRAAATHNTQDTERYEAFNELNVCQTVNAFIPRELTITSRGSTCFFALYVISDTSLDHSYKYLIWRQSHSTIRGGGDRTVPSPGRTSKHSLPGIGLHDPLHDRQACTEFN